MALGALATKAGTMLAVTAGLGTCQSASEMVPDSAAPFSPVYLHIDTRLLDDDLVGFIVTMKGARSKADVADYAKCAAARYALIRGYGFARHVRTKVEESDGIWRGDAVYTVSAALPAGVLTLDAEVVVANCRDDGIPTV